MDKVRILVVDDDAEIRSALADILKSAGYCTEEAVSGNQALEKVISEEYDIALLDMMMPGRDGIDTLIELRRVRPRTRVIMITAFATIENAVTAIKKGASDYISKPFKIKELLNTIRRVLEETRFDNSVKNLNLGDTLSSLSNSIRRNIICLLNSRSKMRLMEITRELDIEDHTKVVFHLKLLKEAGIVAQGKEKSYFLTKEGNRASDLLKFLENYVTS